jgi:formate hydrogenlyase subunit 3/multisubunit Na+/H+ antiporter MnhD subunit
MDPVHIHLFLNHVPIIGSIGGAVFLAYGMARNSDEVKRLALGLLVLTAAIAIPVFLTGEPSEDVVEGLAGVSKPLIEEHEDAGKLALIISITTGCVALLALFFSLARIEVGKFIVWITLGVSILGAFAMARAGNLGGQIRHSEIRADATAPQSSERSPGAAAKRDDDDH